MLTADHSPAVNERLVAPPDTRQRGFWIGVMCAVAFHGLLILGAGRSSPRHVGDPDGTPDAIAVELVTEADLKSRETVALPPPGAVAAPPPQPTATAPPQPAPTPPPQPDAAPAPPAEAPAPQPKQEAAPAANDLALPDLADLSPLVEKAKPAEKPAEKQSKPKPPAMKKPAPQARLDLSPPAAMQQAPSAAPGRSELFTRPPGVTRSGENDAFGLGVVRALRGTMPPPSGVFGRVRVRLILTENGDLAEVRVVESSGNSRLDQSVVFAVKQTTFPFPPVGASVIDRTFLIGYVYR